MTRGNTCPELQMERFCGKPPYDFKSMPGIGKGVEENRLWDDAGTFRVIYTARLADTGYVPGLATVAFKKKPPTTTKRDIDIAKARFAKLMRNEK